MFSFESIVISANKIEDWRVWKTKQVQKTKRAQNTKRVQRTARVQRLAGIVRYLLRYLT